MDFFTVSDEYINFLKESDDSIDNFDDNPLGKKVYIGPLFPIDKLWYYAPISNGFQYLEEKNNQLQIKEDLGPTIIISLDDEFLGAIEIGKMIPAYDLTKLEIAEIENKDYQELLQMISRFVDENRIEIKQYAYSIYNLNKKG